MTATVVGALVAAAIATPHGLRLDRSAPMVAATIWLSALALRAITAIFLAVFVVLYVPTTALFDALTHWCWHAVLPLMTTHLGLDGHRVGDAATLTPALFLAASLLSVLYGLVRTVRAVQRWVCQAAVGTGPTDSLVIASPDLLVATAGLARPRVVVSAGALEALDDEELAAGLAHERAHIARRHRFVLVLAEGCRALGRVLPGSKRAADELVFHLERDADRWAVEQRHHPSALASAICKVAVPDRPSNPMRAYLGGGRLSERLRQLLHAGEAGPSTMQRRATLTLAAAMVTLTLVLVALTPPALAAGFQTAKARPPVEHCQR